MKRDNGNYEADFQWLNNEIEVEVFHDKYYSAETLSMSLDDLKAMISGKYLAWTFEEKEYSHVLYLEDPAKNFLKKLLNDEHWVGKITVFEFENEYKQKG